MQSIYDHKYVEFLRIDRLGEEFKWLIDVNELVSTFQNWVYKYLGQQILGRKRFSLPPELSQ